jgi:aconitate decarboxylase
MTATNDLLHYVEQLRFEHLSTRTLSHAQLFIEDSLGVALAGHLGSFTPQLLRAVRAQGSGDEARVWGSRLRLPAANAAMVNAYLIHCLEFDCVHEAAVVHPMAVILATLLAQCERQPELTGADLLLGVVTAVDVAACLGMASRAKMRFFRPAQCGAFGAAAALAKLAGMDQAGIRNVLGVLLGQISGTLQAHREGAPLLPMQIAFNARNAISAFDFARHGLRGPSDVFEGEFGYLPLFEGSFDLVASVQSLLTQAARGEHAISQVSHKPFPSGRATHGGVDAMLHLLQQHNWHAEQVRSVTLFAPPLIRQLIDRPALFGQGANYLKLCFPYCAASALLQGDLGVLDFSDAAITEERRFRLAQKIHVQADDNSDPNALAPIRVLMENNQGQRCEMRVCDVLGAPGNPLSAIAHWHKLQKNVALFDAHDATSRTETITSAVRSLAAMPSAAALLQALPVGKSYLF